MKNPERKTALLTLGRLPKALDIARALAGKGFRVIVAEPFAWHLCRASRSVSRSYRVGAPAADPLRYRQDLLDIIHRERVDLLVPISEEAMHVVPIAADLPAGTRLLAAEPHLVRQLHDKQAFIRLASGYGLATPATALLGSDQARRLAEGCDVVLKPVFSCAGRNIRFLRAGETLPAALPGQPILVQRRLTGEHLSTLSLAHCGRPIATIIYRGTLFSGTVAAGFERIDCAPVDEWVRAFVQRTGYSGFVAFDFVADEHGVPHAIECNPRLTSGVHFMEPSSLAEAMLDPRNAKTIAVKPFTKMHQFYTTLTESQSAMFRPSRFKPFLHIMRTHADVTWDRSDPWPFLLMTPLSVPIIARAIRHKTSLGDAATRDIARLSPDH